LTISLKNTHALAVETGCTVREVELAALRNQILPVRYQRSFGTVGWEGQIRLLESTVAIVGCGGLGGWIIEGLARMGVGHLILIDGDTFEENNLNRQALCWEANLGQAKVEAAEKRVQAINAATQVTVHHVWARAETLPELLASADVIVDALDNLPTRLVLQDVAAALGKPLVHGAIAGYVGQVLTVLPGDPGLRALYGSGLVPEKGVETVWGNPAATPMMTAAWQIQEVIKLLLGRGTLLRKRMLFMDAEAGMVEILGLEGEEACES